MNDQQKVLKAIQQDDLTIHEIHDITGIDKLTLKDVILPSLKRQGLAAISVDKRWRGMVRGRDFGGYGGAA